MKIAIASDHAGFVYKERIREYLADLGHDVEDFGTYSAESCDYPDFIRPAAQAVADGRAQRGIVLGGSGNGEAIVSNRVPGVRCAIAWDLRSARYSREHNDANVLSLGQRMLAYEEVTEILDLWLATPFEGGRHQRRIKKIDAE
ncbi:MAG: ribose 5-phosphate isomerase B [Planctomycetota bacterium]